MRTQEDKYMASQLNSLGNLPEGYQANISSKWEMIEMGMEQKKRRLPIIYWMAAACLLLMFAGTWHYTMNRNQEQDLARDKNKQQEKKAIKKGFLEEKNTEALTATVGVKTKEATSSSIASTVSPYKKVIVVPTNADTALIAINKPITPVVIEQQPPTDSSHSINNMVTATQPAIKKVKQRFYQMDFGEGTPNDLKQKTATGKLIQFRLSSKAMEDGNSPVPAKTNLQIAQPL